MSMYLHVNFSLNFLGRDFFFSVEGRPGPQLVASLRCWIDHLNDSPAYASSRALVQCYARLPPAQVDQLKATVDHLLATDLPTAAAVAEAVPGVTASGVHPEQHYYYYSISIITALCFREKPAYTLTCMCMAKRESYNVVKGWPSPSK